MKICLERWTSQVEFIKLRVPLPLKIRKGVDGYDIFCKTFSLVGSGRTLPLALEMLFDHLMVDYYEYSLNPGVQTLGDKTYGRRLRKLFNTSEEKKKNILIDFHQEG